MRRRKIGPERVTSVTGDMLTYSGVPERYWRAQLSEIEGNPKFKREVAQYVRSIHEHAEAGIGLLLHGGLNTGKTSLAVIALKETIQRGGSAHFIYANDIPAIFFDDLELETYTGDPIVVKDRVEQSNVTIIDDLGAEKWDPKAGAGAELEGILRRAYGNFQVVIVTTNLPDQKAIEQRYTKSVASLLARITLGVQVTTDQWKRK